MYGRGCTAAFMQAQVLADALGASPDPSARAEHYYTHAWQQLEHYFRISIATDRMYRMRARLQRGAQPTLAERMTNYGYERVWLPGTYRSPLLAREFLKSMQMRELSSVGTRFAALGQLLWSLVRSWFRPRLPSPTPPRQEFLARLSAQLRQRQDAS
jgi:hypothetical protein